MRALPVHDDVLQHPVGQLLERLVQVPAVDAFLRAGAIRRRREHASGVEDPTVARTHWIPLVHTRENRDRRKGLQVRIDVVNRMAVLMPFNTTTVDAHELVCSAANRLNGLCVIVPQVKGRPVLDRLGKYLLRRTVLPTVCFQECIGSSRHRLADSPKRRVDTVHVTVMVNVIEVREFVHPRRHVNHADVCVCDTQGCASGNIEVIVHDGVPPQIRTHTRHTGCSRALPPDAILIATHLVDAGASVPYEPMSHARFGVSPRDLKSPVH